MILYLHKLNAIDMGKSNQVILVEEGVFFNESFDYDTVLLLMDRAREEAAQ